MTDQDGPGQGDTIWYRKRKGPGAICALVTDCGPDEFEVSTGAFGKRSWIARSRLVKWERGSSSFEGQFVAARDRSGTRR